MALRSQGALHKPNTSSKAMPNGDLPFKSLTDVGGILAKDGRIISAAYQVSFRLTPAGVLDSTFGMQATALVMQGNSLIVGG